jgi:glutathione peroxidase
VIERRAIITAALAAIAGPASMRTALAQAAMSRITAYAFSFPALAGGDIRLADYAGRPLLVVNTASSCGFTPQYAGLQELWNQFHDRGLMIIGVPPTISEDRSPAAPPRSRRPRSTNMGSPFPSLQKPP